MYKIFVDGQVGTTGLQIHRHLQDRDDIQLVQIEDQDRKNVAVKKELLNSSDLVILCLPDDAARQSVALIDTDEVKVLDASTAHRVNEDWVYGLPELSSEQRNRIGSARFVSNPGCYPTAFILPLAPLIRDGLLPADSLISALAISGYTGGGRKLIEQYEQRLKADRNEFWPIRPYGLQLNHKHLPEMQHFSGLDSTPLFTPSVGPFAQGLLLHIPLFRSQLSAGVDLDCVYEALLSRYRGEACIKIHPVNDDTALDDGFLDPQENNDTNRVDIFLYGSERQLLLIARLDNLGKGASGAAVQNLNLMLGCEELYGLAT